MTQRLARVPLRRGPLPALLVVVVVAIGMLAGGADVAERPARKLLFIGIDGVRVDVLKAAYTPYLKGLMRGGAFAYDTRILGERYRLNDTVSAPGWSSLLTGVWADKHGVNGSAFQDTLGRPRRNDASSAWGEDSQIVGRPTPVRFVAGNQSDLHLRRGIEADFTPPDFTLCEFFRPPLDVGGAGVRIDLSFIGYFGYAVVWC